MGFPTSRTIPSAWLHLTAFWIICLSSHASVFHSVLGCLYLFILAKIYIVILFTFFRPTITQVGHVGTASISIAVLYYLNLKLASNLESNDNQSSDLPNPSESMLNLILRFVFFAIVIVISSFNYDR